MGKSRRQTGCFFQKKKRWIGRGGEVGMFMNEVRFGPRDQVDGVRRSGG